MPAETTLDVESLRRQHYNATLTHLERPNPDLMIMRIQPDFAIPPHKPGQYTTLGLGYWEEPASDLTVRPALDRTRLLRRSYSISHPIITPDGKLYSPGEPPGLEFYLVLVRNTGGGEAGELTSRLVRLKIGDRLHMGERITGHYTTDAVTPRDTVLFLATGTGEAPHNYMIWDLLRRGHQGMIVAVCCVRYRRDLGYLSTYERLAAFWPRFRYLPMTTRDGDPNKPKRYIQDIIRDGTLEQFMGAKLDPASTHVFVCGNPTMIGVPTVDRSTGKKTYPVPTGVCEVLEEKGFVADHAATKVKGNIHFEEYW